MSEVDKDHNIKELEQFIQECFAEYADCDEQSAHLNKKRQKIREKVEAKGIDKKAFHDQYMRAKRKRKSEKEGYDEGAKICFEALNKMDQGNLFEFLDKAEKEKEEEREAKAKAREKAKAKADTFKPAPERKPKPAVSKPISGKDAAAGEKVDEDSEKSVGVQQAAAYQKAHGTTKTVQ